MIRVHSPVLPCAACTRHYRDAGLCDQGLPLASPHRRPRYPARPADIMCREECGRQADADELVNCFIPYPAAMQTCRPCALGFWGTDLLQGQVSTGCEIPDRTLTGWEAGLFLKGTQVLFRYQPAYRFVQMEGASR